MPWKWRLKQPILSSISRIRLELSQIFVFNFRNKTPIYSKLKSSCDNVALGKISGQFRESERARNERNDVGKWQFVECVLADKRQLSALFTFASDTYWILSRLCEKPISNINLPRRENLRSNRGNRGCMCIV